MNYQDFLESKRIMAPSTGIEVAESEINPMLFPFQRKIVQWGLNRGRAAVLADCGLGKSFIQIEWARLIGGDVLILAPLAVGPQTVREAAKLGVTVTACRSQVDVRPGLNITNYEMLQHFDTDAFRGVVCDESSILKSFEGAYKAEITEFMRTVPYRLLCTATAAPNDYIELGTHSEALGDLGYVDMLNRFFINDQKTIDPRHTYHGARRDQDGRMWRFKGHAQGPFWRWVCSWARAVRKPSDLGFPDDGFVLPPLIENETVVKASRPAPGRLFDVAAVGLQEEREVRRRTLQERCEAAAEIVARKPNEAWVLWCHLNDEQTMLEKLLGGKAFSVYGSLTVEEKTERLTGWLNGERPYLISKPTVSGYGLNMQHCHNVVYFPSDSYEQYYQAVRRCWRFGQEHPVTVEIVRTDGQERMMANLHRKSEAANQMFSDLVAQMNDAMRLERGIVFTNPVEVPAWL